MLNFSYSFQRILDIKEKETENAQAQVAKALRNLNRAETRFERVNEELRQAEGKLYEQQERGVSISELRTREMYINHLRDRMKEEKAALHLANKNVHKKQDILFEKLKEEKKWSIHKEKLAQQYIDELKKKEQLELDELSSQRFYFQSSARSEEVGRK